MAPLQTYIFPCRSDNFGVLVHDPETGATAAIDTPETAAVMGALQETGWQLSEIWITHHHADHVEGLEDVRRATGAKVLGPAAEADRIGRLDVALADGDTHGFAGREVAVIATPGHTKGHIVYHVPQDELLFAGDTLFVMGCGRLIEDGPDAMWNSLTRLAALPGETRVFCGHEYTLANGRFALSLDKDNAALQARMSEMEDKASRGEPTIPSTIADERATNPFLRADTPELARAVGLHGAEPARVFAELRERKNKA
jgi:hydroxyacylglutathione hydrolase